MKVDVSALMIMFSSILNDRESESEEEENAKRAWPSVSLLWNGLNPHLVLHIAP